jgi:hypothetical protein
VKPQRLAISSDPKIGAARPGHGTPPPPSLNQSRAARPPRPPLAPPRHQRRHHLLRHRVHALPSLSAPLPYLYTAPSHLHAFPRQARIQLLPCFLSSRFPNKISWTRSAQRAPLPPKETYLAFRRSIHLPVQGEQGIINRSASETLGGGEPESVQRGAG